MNVIINALIFSYNKSFDYKFYLDGDYCANNNCALGCADCAVAERLETYYNASSKDHRIDFNFCHPLWKKYCITINPPSQDTQGRYYAIGSVAAMINVTALSIGFYLILKLTKEKKISDEATSEAKGWKAKLMSFKESFMITLPVLLQVSDSLLDALYFIKLKTGHRIIHVPPAVHVIQALLLFTC